MNKTPEQSSMEQLVALQNAIQSSQMGFFELQSDGRMELDSIARSHLGLSPSSPINDLTDFLMCIDETQHEALLDAIDAARSQNRPLAIILRLENHENGRPSGFKLSAGALHKTGEREPRLSGLLQSIPESTLEAEDRSNKALAEARSANTELANFASIASHDMREPLRMVTSYLRLLQERAPEALDSRARRYIDYASQGADRMRSLIEDLLSYARLDKSVKDFEPVAIEDIMAEAIDNLKVSIRDAKADITVAIDYAPIVMGDRVRLCRLFQNLIANAVKFNQPDEVPRVKVYFTNGDRADAPGKWIVHIEDKGIGIHPDHHEILFSLFQRLNTRDEFEGSGIGLAVCKKIAEQHAGRIWFESTYGQGSTFSVALQKADASNLQPQGARLNIN